MNKLCRTEFAFSHQPLPTATLFGIGYAPDRGNGDPEIYGGTASQIRPQRSPTDERRSLRNHSALDRQQLGNGARDVFC